MESEQDAFAPLKGPVGRRRQAWCLGVGLIAGVMFGGVVASNSTRRPTAQLQKITTTTPVTSHNSKVFKSSKATTQATTAVEHLAASTTASTSETASASYSADDWMQRDDVIAMSNLKVVYGEMSADLHKSLFETFKTDFSRSYESETEETMRFGLFKENMKSIDYLNKYNPLALFGITESTDRTVDEISQRKMSKKWASYSSMKAALPSELVSAAAQGPDAVAGKSFKGSLQGTVDQRSLTEGISQGQFAWASESDCAACDQFPGFKAYNSSNAPENFDWRALGAVTGVKNQKYCGSCWTFSTAQDVEGTHYLATGKLVPLSEQQLVSCDTANFGCDGGWMFAAMQYVADFGILVSEKDYPYNGVMMTYDLPTPTCETAMLSTKLEEDIVDDVAHVEGFQFVAMGDEYEELMKTVLVKNGPLSVAINAAGMDYYVHGIVGCESIAGSDYCEAGSIDEHSPCDPEDLDHGVLAVAYGVQDGTDYWVIKNSWGTSWGEDGYYRIERGVNKCGVANMVSHSVFKKA